MREFTNSKDYLEFLTESSSSRHIAELAGDSFAVREYKKAQALADQANEWTKLFGSAKSARDYAAEMGIFTSQNSLKNMVESITGAHAQADLLKSMGLVQSVTQPTASRLALREYVDALDIAGQVKKMGLGPYGNWWRDHHSAESASVTVARKAASDALAAVTLQSEYERATASANWIQQLTKSLAEDDLYRRFLGTLDIRTSVPTEMWSSVAEAARRRYESVLSSNDAWLNQLERMRQPEYLSSILSVIQQGVAEQDFIEDFQAEESSEGADDEVLLQELTNADSPERFAEIFSRCSRWLKWAVLNFVVFVVWPLAMGVAGNLLTPHVEKYLQQAPAAPQREQVKEIKKLTMGELGVELREYRFSTAKTLDLRESPNARARKVEKLHLGQVLAVVSTKRDWTEVIYEYGDGEAISGWVFTRYLEKFRQ